MSHLHLGVKEGPGGFLSVADDGQPRGQEGKAKPMREKPLLGPGRAIGTSLSDNT